ncbi:TetR/AcrR family transcriptional regulator [Rhodococcus koreensis]|uniref:DNA-binding transcriptional regulator, AcrR family n=1 Tax=Rhodococcus koreensis TaxID=99653 RepID=A0A1H4KY57_9NOCA|nr:TetR/AcrR family transcriptional regulator [Rhodococcus koreensis]SEB63058.1 DNA-binding transcriptional regulator, AcrR family [Rhodococcus koreensis]
MAVEQRGAETRLRADAQENYDRLVAAAGRMFSLHGTDASLKAIAEEAGVGIGTLYRRFPTREQLVEAVYRSTVTEICYTATNLVESMESPVEAFRAWAGQLVEFLVSKRGMAEALQSVWSADDDFRVETRQRLTDALEALLREGNAAGALRADVDALDVLRVIGGISYAADDSVHALRLLDLLIDGLRPRVSR